MEKKDWKILAILLIILFTFSMIATLWFWAGTLYWKGEYEKYAGAFIDCAENFKKCSNDFTDAVNSFKECLKILEEHP